MYVVDFNLARRPRPTFGGLERSRGRHEVGRGSPAIRAYIANELYVHICKNVLLHTSEVRCGKEGAGEKEEEEEEEEEERCFLVT